MSVRHRGLKLVTEAGHTPGVITCAYHCWSYGLDGSLKGTPYLDGTAKSTPPESLRSRFRAAPGALSGLAGHRVRQYFRRCAAL